MKALTIIAENYDFWCPESNYNSFSWYLYKEEKWYIEKYWLLEYALFELVTSPIRDEELNWKVFHIFSKTLMLLSAHFDSNDGFKIQNLEREQLYEFRERFQLVFEGFFSKNMPEIHQCFDTQNPLLNKRNPKNRLRLLKF